MPEIMAIQIPLMRSQISDLRSIVDLNPGILDRVVERIDQLDQAPIAPAALQAAIAEAMGENPDAVNSILRVALSFASLRRRQKLEPDELLSGVRQSLRSALPPWGDDLIDRWERME